MALVVMVLVPFTLLALAVCFKHYQLRPTPPCCSLYGGCCAHMRVPAFFLLSAGYAACSSQSMYDSCAYVMHTPLDSPLLTALRAASGVSDTVVAAANAVQRDSWPWATCHNLYRVPCHLCFPCMGVDVLTCVGRHCSCFHNGYSLYQPVHV